MLDLIRPATPEEVESIKTHADLTTASAVVAFGKENPVLAVIRHCTELDPVYFPEGLSDQKKALFIWGVTSAIKMSGLAPEVYFNISAEDEKWRKVIENYGAEPVFSVPTLRYKKVLR